MTQGNGGSIWAWGTSKISSKISHELEWPPAALAPWFVPCCPVSCLFSQFIFPIITQKQQVSYVSLGVLVSLGF